MLSNRSVKVQEAGIEPNNRDDVDAAIKLLTELGIVTEMTGQRKNRSFGYQNYIELLARAE